MSGWLFMRLGDRHQWFPSCIEYLAEAVRIECEAILGGRVFDCEIPAEICQNFRGIPENSRVTVQSFGFPDARFICVFAVAGSLETTS